MAPDSLQPIAAAVTPAVMVSACGLIALGLDNQAARMAARLREMSREIRDLPHSGHEAVLREQVGILGRRHRLYIRALLLNYGALFAFVVTSLLFLTIAWLPGASLLPVATFTAGVLMLGGMAIFVLASLRLSRSAIALEERRTLAPRDR